MKTLEQDHAFTVIVNLPPVLTDSRNQRLSVLINKDLAFLPENTIKIFKTIILPRE
jgi:hypothetical protein